MKSSSEKLKEIIEIITETPGLITKNFTEYEDDFFTDIFFSDDPTTDDEKIIPIQDQNQANLVKLLETFPNLNTENAFLEYYYDFLAQIPENWSLGGSENEFSYFDAIWPTYSQMDQKQRDYYFYWRDQFRNENYLETDTGYLKLFAYELLTMSQIEDPERIYSLYLNLLLKYGEDFKHLRPTLLSWFLDLIFYHQLEDHISELPEKIMSENRRISNFLLNKQISDPGLYMDLNLIEPFSDYKITQSPLFEDNEKIYKDLIPKVINFVDNFLRKKTGSGVFETYLTGEMIPVKYFLYPGAVTPETGKQVETEYFDFNSKILKDFFTQILKFIENQVRGHFHYRGRLKNISLDAELEKYLLAFINRELNPSKKSENRKLSINSLNETKIENLRKQSDIVRKSLEVEEIDTESDIVPLIAEPPVTEEKQSESSLILLNDNTNLDEEFSEFLNALQPYQLKAIYIIHDGQDVENQLKILADEYISLPELIIDEINELSYEILDNLFIENDVEPSIAEDYLDIVEELKLNEK